MSCHCYADAKEHSLTHILVHCCVAISRLRVFVFHNIIHYICHTGATTTSHFARLCHKAGVDIKVLSAFEDQYLEQLKSDYIWRVRDASMTDEADVRAQPERFPHLLKLIDSAN
jgi:hypothetical protein